MYALHYRQELDEAVQREFDAFIARLKGIILKEHNEDGSHQFDFSNLNDDALQRLIDAAQAKGQWWKTGPWILDDPAGVEPHKVGLRPSTPTGTYHNFAPTGIDGSVVLEIEPDGGDVTLTGIQALDGKNFKRIVMLRNRDNTNSVHLLHDDSGSIEAFRFDLPDGEDVELAPGQNVWLYYDPGRERWTAAITGQAAGAVIQAGGSGGGQQLLEASLTIDRTDINSWSSSPLLIVSAVAGKVIVPVQLTTHYYQHTGGGQWLTSYSVSLRYSGNTQDVLTSQTIIPSSGSPATNDFTTLNSATTNLSYTSSTFNPVNKDLVVKGSSNANSGEGESTDYIEVKLQYLLVTVP
jgi:hypothetical protein